MAIDRKLKASFPVSLNPMLDDRMPIGNPKSEATAMQLLAWPRVVKWFGSSHVLPLNQPIVVTGSSSQCCMREKLGHLLYVEKWKSETLNDWDAEKLKTRLQMSDKDFLVSPHVKKSLLDFIRHLLMSPETADVTATTIKQVENGLGIGGSDL